jgi:hypothetical protein
MTLANSWLLHTEYTVLLQSKYDEWDMVLFRAFLTSSLDGNDQLHNPDHPTLTKGRGYPTRKGVWWTSESVWMLPRYENPQFLPQIKRLIYSSHHTECRSYLQHVVSIINPYPANVENMVSS